MEVFTNLRKAIQKLSDLEEAKNFICNHFKISRQHLEKHLNAMRAKGKKESEIEEILHLLRAKTLKEIESRFYASIGRQ